MQYIPSAIRRHFLTLAFVAGFVTDLLLLNQVDDVFDNIILLFYVVLATIALVAMYIGVAERGGELVSRWLRQYSPMIVQYAFGGLLSGMLIFYGRSGDWLGSWPFFVIIIIAILGNELVQNRAQRLVFQLSVYFIGLFSYVVLFVATFSGKTEAWVFFGSGIIAMVIVYFLVFLIARIIPNFVRYQIRYIIFSLGCIYIGLNVLYITSILPPIPLSLKEITIAHTVEFNRETRQYTIVFEPIPIWNIVERYAPTLHLRDSQSVACFTKVFAPTRLQAGIYHQWDYYDTEARVWVERFRVPYEVSGVATQGYRGFSTTTNIRDGKWRCIVKNARGQSLGRKVFYIDTSAQPKNIKIRID
jgi:hypothetical protein